MSFESLGLHADILRAICEQGYTQATPVQQQAIPIILNGQDILAGAQTGTGKTAGFTLPILQLLNNDSHKKSNLPRALVLTPTRELAAQVGESIETYGQYLDIDTAIIFGGVNVNPQIKRLKQGVDIVVATPGRLLDIANQGFLKLSKVEYLVLDEADRMLDMGFIRDIKKIIALLPKKRQNLLFSATFSDEIRELAKGLLNEPEYIQIAPRNATAEKVSQMVYPVEKTRKRELISWLISSQNWQQVLIFTRTKHGADRLVKQLKQDGIHCSAIHGNKSQNARTKALADFKSNEIRALVATDIAARGLDIDQLPHVVNYELPQVAEDYVHRIGRTGRAGSNGEAISLVCPDELKNLQSIERLIKQNITKNVIDDYQRASNNPSSTKKQSSQHHQPNQNPANLVEDTVHYSQRSRRAKAANNAQTKNKSSSESKIEIIPVFDEEIKAQNAQNSTESVSTETAHNSPQDTHQDQTQQAADKQPNQQPKKPHHAQQPRAARNAPKKGPANDNKPFNKPARQQYARDENGDVNGNVRNDNEIDDFEEHIKKNVIWKPEANTNRRHHNGGANAGNDGSNNSHARANTHKRSHTAKPGTRTQKPARQNQNDSGQAQQGNGASQENSAPKRSTTRHPHRRRQSGPAIG